MSEKLRRLNIVHAGDTGHRRRYGLIILSMGTLIVVSSMDLFLVVARSVLSNKVYSHEGPVVFW